MRWHRRQFLWHSFPTSAARRLCVSVTLLSTLALASYSLCQRKISARALSNIQIRAELDVQLFGSNFGFYLGAIKAKVNQQRYAAANAMRQCDSSSLKLTRQKEF